MTAIPRTLDRLLDTDRRDVDRRGEPPIKGELLRWF